MALSWLDQAAYGLAGALHGPCEWWMITDCNDGLHSLNRTKLELWAAHDDPVWDADVEKAFRWLNEAVISQA
jgi:hypothetical protein